VTSSPVRIGRRTALALTAASVCGLFAFLWPLIGASNSTAITHASETPWLFAILLPLVITVVLADLADGGLDAKGIALIGVLSAIAAALRPFGGGHAGFEPMWIVIILGGRVLGPGAGFGIGAIGMFASALLTGGVGPWLAFQMIAAGWVGLIAGLLPQSRGRAELALLAGYAAIACIAYGFLLNLWFWPTVTISGSLPTELSFIPGAGFATNIVHWLRFCIATSLGFDIPRAVLTVALIVIAGRPILNALRRASRRAAFDAPVEFLPAPHGTPV
jgi:energy-coupling factor transport system substrate-specific component